MDKTGISFFLALSWHLIKISLTRPSRNYNPSFWFDHKLPHLSGVPRLRVNRPKWYKALHHLQCGAQFMLFQFFSRSAKSPSPQGEYLWENENCTVVIADPFNSSFKNKTIKFCNSDWTWLPEIYNLQLTTSCKIHNNSPNRNIILE